MNSVSERRGAAWRIARTAVVLGLGVWAVAARPAHAQQIQVELVVQEAPQKAPDPKADKGDKDGTPPPIFRAVVIGAIPGLAAEQFTIRQEDTETPVSITADKVRTYVESDDPMALVVLVQGDERWMGNETYIDAEDPDRMEGAYTSLGLALDALAKAGPPGSKAALLVYTQGRADAKVPMGDASQLSASALGSQQDYKDNIGVPLLVGLDEALNLFDKHAGYRKILVVIGDGTGQEEDMAEGLKDRVNKLEQRKVEVFSIYYESIVSGSPEGQNNMKKIGYTEAKSATSRENFETFAKQFVEHIGARYYATFPGCTTKKPPVCLTMDGQLHDFVVKAGDMESDVISIKTPMFQQAPPEKEGSLWWLWLLLGLLLIGVVVLIVVVRARRVEPPPEPVFVDVPPPPVAGPSKTMMINAGTGEGGMPIVGWIVALTGANQYQTFKLLHGVTKIGTGMDCNIVVQDQFMSHYHCEIICSPLGFMLKDGGSTNGTLVNERRVASHELVDNDMITMGKTNFKFKSIN
jgi:hypothetical protein